MSPYYGDPDFSRLDRTLTNAARIDLVSLADLLRNGFVYAPHSIFEGIKVATFGFDPDQDMHAAPEFRFLFRDSEKCREPGDPQTDWVGTYHRLLCKAVAEACANTRSPWLLQSGGKDSTPLAIAAAQVRPDTVCITYMGGREENEVESARLIAKKLGLRHETLVCDPGRAYDRYLAIVDRMPLLTADFALLSYVDLATDIVANGGDGVLDGMGADNYFGTPVHWQQKLLSWLARDVRWPRFVSDLPLLNRSFRYCYLLSTLQMNSIERSFPGSRFTDEEVDELLGRDIARASKARLALFRSELSSANNADEHFAMALTVAGSGGGFAKGLYTAGALSLRLAYPFCNSELREWVYRQVPPDQRLDPVTRTSKVLMRRYIATQFDQLPYVARKGSFRFDLRALARHRFDRIHSLALQTREVLPGAPAWLARNRKRLDNKYHASKFYLLAVVLPWIQSRCQAERTVRAAPGSALATVQD